MKKITLDAITKKNGEYTIFLSSEHRFTFKNKRYAEVFQKKLSKYLQESIQLQNEYLIKLYTYYREYYYRLKGYELSSLSFTVRSIEENLNRIFKLSSSKENGPAYTYSSINYIYDSLISGYNTLIKVCKRDKNYFLSRGLESLKKGIIITANDFEEFSFNKERTQVYNSRLEVLNKIS